MKNWFNRSHLLIALLCLIFNLPATADEVLTINEKVKSTGDNTVVVSFADLDLSKQAGVNELHNRLEIAAQAVCRPLIRDSRIPGAQQLYNMCYKETLAKAFESVNNKNVAMSDSTGR